MESPWEETPTQILETPPTASLEPRPTGPAYVPPAISPRPPAPMDVRVDVGRWLSEGWKLFARQWPTFALATLVAGFLSMVTLTITTGPFLLGLYFMAFQVMRGERIQLGDLFKGFEQFGLAFLAWIIEVFIHLSLGGLTERAPLMGLISLAFSPLAFALFAFVYPLILDRKLDIAAALNEAWRIVISRQWVMFWVLGIVFLLILTAGLLGCGIGVFVTLPWIICAAAVAYRDIFGVRSWPPDLFPPPPERWESS
ncbi:MAG: hypothetical protein N0A16_06625 [Blastocatellia bacterium]|nr:hypothetical protein [Blastocatellia bacterium]MCS7157383.1 hypothetical protein [Blastocatellia bacterium]MCX7753249.1 hypothetical protein [Blastocatellia bacterium]MDW8255419.1 hypothetical protein [Acidobacteriota bacterium]